MTVPIKVEEAQAGDREAWDAYLAARDAPPSAAWAWSGILDASYRPSLIRLVARNGSGGIAGLAALYAVRDWRRHVHVYSLRHGFLADDAATSHVLAKAAAAFAQKRRATSLVISSGSTPLEVDGWHWTRTSVRLPLQAQPDPMWTGLRDKVRNMIRKAERSGLQCAAGAKHLGSFYTAYAARLGARGVPLHSRRFFKAMLDRSDTVLYSAVADGRPVGGMIFQYGTRTALYFQSSFHPAAASLGVGQFLMWHAIKDSITRGQTAVDMGESAPDSGTFAFKTQVGGVAEPVHYYDLLRPKEEHEAPAWAPSRPSLAAKTLAKLPLAARIPLLRRQRRLTRLV